MRLAAMLFAVAGVVSLAKDPAPPDLRYNPATVVDVRGVIAEVHVVLPGATLPGVHITLKTKAETVDVFLAPSAFLKLVKLTVAAGDDIRVVGSRMNGTILVKEFFRKGES